MKTESKIFLFLTVFFAVMSPIYAYVTATIPNNSGDAHPTFEVIGTTALILTMLFCAMIWGLLALTGKSVGPRPEDRGDANIVEGAGTLGFFPASSLVPFWSAVAVATIFCGVVFGWWLTVIGVGVGIYAAFGWAYEFYVGEFKH